MDWPAHSWNVCRRNFGAAPAPMHPVLLAAGFGHRGDPRVLLDLGRVRIAVTLRAKAAIRRGTSTSRAPGRESKMAKSGWAFASCSICRSYSRIDSFEGGERAHRGTRGRPHGDRKSCV